MLLGLYYRHATVFTLIMRSASPAYEHLLLRMAAAAMMVKSVRWPALPGGAGWAGSEGVASSERGMATFRKGG
jgi:hypothetical protein